MRKLLIIDDEPIIQEGLKHVIPWNEYGYEICDVGVNGRDGINKIRLHQPDLVMLDIRMPGLSGIDIISQLRKENYTTKFIILTAYSSFSYAKQLMGLGIEHYLLKPVVETELLEVLEKIEQEREKEQKLQDQLAWYNHLNEERTLRTLLEGKLDHVSETLLQSFTAKELQLVRIFNDIQPRHEQWLMERVAENPEHMKLIRKDDYDHLLFIQKGPAFMHPFLAKMKKTFQEHHDQKIVLLIADPIEGPEMLGEAYQQIKALINVQFCYSEKEILSAQDLLIYSEPVNKPDEEETRRKLYHYIEFGDQQNSRKILSEVETYYQHTLFSKERIKAEIFEWSVTFFDLIQRNYPDLTPINKDEWASKINKQPHLQAIIQLIERELQSFSEAIKGETARKSNIIDQVKEYVQFYYNEDISLKYVAELFHYNSAYLGKMFKKATGEYFNVYLHQVRIEKAKQLLKGNQHKVNEIAALVGYSNADYFYKNFKQFEDISPKEFQMKQRKEMNR